MKKLSGLMAKMDKAAPFLLVIVMVAILAAPALAAWKSSWNYSASDLGGGNCLQDAVDDIADRVGATSTAAAKTAVLSTNATTFLYLQKGSTSATGSTVTQSFATVFSEAPTISWRYTTAGIAATNPVAVASNQFVITAAQTNFEWIAVGAKP